MATDKFPECTKGVVKMSMKSYKQAVCDSCGNGIDVYPYPISTRRFNDILECGGAIVVGKKHYCNKECQEKSL